MKIEMMSTARPESRRKTLKTRIESVIRRTIQDDADHQFMGQLVREIDVITKKDRLESRKYEELSSYLGRCIETFKTKGENVLVIQGYREHWSYTPTLASNLGELRHVSEQLKHECLLEEQTENKYEFESAFTELTELEKQHGVLIARKYNNPAVYLPGTNVEKALELYENLVQKAKERFELICSIVGYDTSRKWMQEIAELKSQQELDIT